MQRPAQLDLKTFANKYKKNILLHERQGDRDVDREGENAHTYPEN